MPKVTVGLLAPVAAVREPMVSLVPLRSKTTPATSVRTTVESFAIAFPPAMRKVPAVMFVAPV